MNHLKITKKAVRHTRVRKVIMKQRGINVFRQKQLSMAKQRAERQAQIDRYTKKPEQAEMDF